MNQYEAMFLFDPTYGATMETCESEINRLMGRIDAEVVFCKKWDERRLAYRVKGRKRGVYVLVYFKAAGNRIVELERDVKISENVLRILVVSAADVTSEMMEQAVTLRGALPEGSPEAASFGGYSYQSPRRDGPRRDGPNRDDAKPADAKPSGSADEAKKQDSAPATAVAEPPTGPADEPKPE